MGKTKGLSIQTANTPIPYQLVRFVDQNTSQPRFLIVDRRSGTPQVAASMFETHLQHKIHSHNSIQSILNHFLLLYTWADQSTQNLDAILISGEALDRKQIRAFRSWLKSRRSNAQGHLAPSQRKSFNAVIAGCSQICTWFVSSFAEFDSTGPSRIIELDTLLQSHKAMWGEEKVKVRESGAAPDLTDDEIKDVENFLKPSNRAKNVGIDTAVRDYLIWRLAIEFGMRIGEILTLMIGDCPSKNSPYFSVIRVEERGPHYFDPRRVQPRPKTLSRDLGILLENSAFPRLVNDYITAHRYVLKESKASP